MKKKPFFFYTLLLSISILFLSCGNQTKSTASPAGNDSTGSSYIQKIKETNAKIEELMLASDYDALLKYFTDDVLILPPLSSEVRGIESLRKEYNDNMKRVVKIRTFGGKVEKIWKNGNIVYEYGTYGSVGTVKGHPKPIAQTVNYFMMWERQNDGSYLIKYIIENLDYNPCN